MYRSHSSCFELQRSSCPLACNTVWHHTLVPWWPSLLARGISRIQCRSSFRPGMFRKQQHRQRSNRSPWSHSSLGKRYHQAAMHIVLLYIHNQGPVENMKRLKLVRSSHMLMTYFGYHANFRGGIIHFFTLAIVVDCSSVQAIAEACRIFRIRWGEALVLGQARTLLRVAIDRIVLQRLFVLVCRLPKKAPQVCLTTVDRHTPSSTLNSYSSGQAL